MQALSQAYITSKGGPVLPAVPAMPAFSTKYPELLSIVGTVVIRGDFEDRSVRKGMEIPIALK